MGKRFFLINAQSSQSEVNTAKDALIKARTMFGDLGLRHDLENLNLVISQIGIERLEV
jgi:hypothetical protein